MMDTIETQAIVLRKVRYGEADLIVTLLGRHPGKFSALARGALKSKKRFAGRLETLRILDIRATTRPQRDLATLNEATVVRDFPALEQDLDKIALASYATELIRETSRDGMDGEPLFALLEEGFASISASESDAVSLRILLHAFELRLLALHGAFPVFDQCYRCGLSQRDMETTYCTRTGEGLLCTKCRHPTDSVGTLRDDTVALLFHLLGLQPLPDPDALDGAAFEQTRRVIDASVGQLLTRPLKSRSLVDELLRLPGTGRRNP